MCFSLLEKGRLGDRRLGGGTQEGEEPGEQVSQVSQVQRTGACAREAVSSCVSPTRAVQG